MEMTRTGGRAATTGVIPGDVALSVGNPGTIPPQGFRWVMLSSYARLESGHTPSRKHPEYWNGGIPWVGIKDATRNHGLEIDTTLQSITQAGLDNSSARLLPSGTVCLSRTASVGYVITMGVPMATSQDFINWVCGPRLASRYLHYILVAEQEAIRRFAHGTTHQTVYYPEAKAFHVCIPERREQDAIVEILTSLDGKIAVNERVRSHSMDLANALYENSTPDEEFTLGDVAEIFDGPHATPKKTESGPWFLSISSLNRGLLDLSESAHLSEEDFPRWTRRVQPQAGDVLFSYETRLGDAALMLPEIRASLGRRMGLLRTKRPQLAGSVLLCAYLSKNFQSEITKRAIHGATVERIPINDLASWPIKLPSPSRWEELSGMLNSLSDSIAIRTSENRALMELRDTLLPQLLSGRLRVRDAEKIVEDMT
ncbi:restriction endonuclease subunit S [Nonomuraea sp. NPDC049714]|uniref:restriction endonuclease subunit S n=1 Tax=Nonomuraea sp. NPDC049714 TaxID=3364357 RepID=UPI003795373F